MKLRTIICTISLLLLISTQAGAEITETRKGASFSQWLDLKVATGTCEAIWVNSPIDRRRLAEIDEYYSLYAIPCSLWAHNQSWLIVLIEDQIGTFDDGQVGFFKPFFFAHGAQGGGLTASDTLDNIRWEEGEKTLVARHYKNGLSHCGELSRYQYNPSLQTFRALDILWQEDCGDINKPWKNLINSDL